MLIDCHKKHKHTKIFSPLCDYFMPWYHNRENQHIPKCQKNPTVFNKEYYYDPAGPLRSPTDTESF